ncbi:MAG: hypothetical protein J0H63_08595 [Rhizobiales bacterium]|nr:hypothetical protein [Hyphomicrobiales bacterium]MBN9010174.1 hypothetical protein [Hyphomicrobiales bacterium]
MRCAFAALAAAWLALSPAALAAEAGRIGLELNDLQPADKGGCRAVFVLKNDIGKALDKMTLRVVAFDAKGKASLFLSLDVGALPVGKTRVLRFDLGDKLACGDVGRMVLDDVTACEGGDLDPPACLAAIALSSRATVPFDF